MLKKRWTLLGVLAAMVVATALAVAALVAPGSSEATPVKSTGQSLTGAGATFPQPLIAQWQREYERLTGVTINYNGVGSGAGIAAITNRQVDFGASDAPLTEEQFAAAKGVLQIPWVLSATSIVYNLPNVKNNLKITGPILAAIYLGQITNWNDSRITALNRGVSLPDLRITPVYRSDNSGTSFNFTDFLSEVSPDWKSRIGRGVNANWPAGVGGRGSSGVAGVVSRTEGAITYVDVAYSLQNRLKFFAVQNRSGKFATPGLRGIRAAALSDKKPSATNELSIVNPPKGKAYTLAYPICTYSYVIVPTQTAKAPQLRRFIFWALTNGQKFGPKLLFQPIPKAVFVASNKALTQVKPG